MTYLGAGITRVNSRDLDFDNQNQTGKKHIPVFYQLFSIIKIKFT